MKLLFYYLLLQNFRNVQEFRISLLVVIEIVKAHRTFYNFLKKYFFNRYMTIDSLNNGIAKTQNSYRC